MGFKPAGGINTVRDAVVYYTIVKEVLGTEWLDNKLFRLGTSRLANLLLSDIFGKENEMLLSGKEIRTELIKLIPYLSNNFFQ